MAAVAMRAPSDVSKDELWQENVRLKKARKRDRDEAQAAESDFMSTATVLGTGAVSAGLWGVLTGYFPRMESFDRAGKWQIAPFVAVAATIGAFLTDDEVSDVMEGLAGGFGFPWLRDVGKGLAGKMASK